MKTSYRQAHEGLSRFQEWIRERPTVILGDFNANAMFEGNNWKDLVERLDRCGLVSAYHRHFGKKPGEEKQWTHFHNGQEDRRFHLDYCFISEDWASRVENVTVGTYADWHTISDHVPLVVDLNL